MDETPSPVLLSAEIFRQRFSGIAVTLTAKEHRLDMQSAVIQIYQEVLSIITLDINHTDQPYCGGQVRMYCFIKGNLLDHDSIYSESILALGYRS